MSSPEHSDRFTASEGYVIGCAFAGAFCLGLAFIGLKPGAGRWVLVVVGAILVAVALSIAFLSDRRRAAETAERREWPAFENALDEGVSFEVPPGMGYAAELPVVLEDMSASGEPSDGQAQNAIVGEYGDIHWCAFQHHRPGGTATVGMVGLLPDRVSDSYPRMRVVVKDPDAAGFDERFDVMCADPHFADRVLSEDVRHELMAVEPFDWRLEGNQVITRVERPSTPEEQIGFITDRVTPLCRVTSLIPLDA